MTHTIDQRTMMRWLAFVTLAGLALMLASGCASLNPGVLFQAKKTTRSDVPAMPEPTVVHVELRRGAARHVADVLRLIEQEGVTAANATASAARSAADALSQDLGAPLQVLPPSDLGAISPHPQVLALLDKYRRAIGAFARSMDEYARVMAELRAKPKTTAITISSGLLGWKTAAGAATLALGIALKVALGYRGALMRTVVGAQRWRQEETVAKDHPLLNQWRSTRNDLTKRLVTRWTRGP